MLRLKNILYPPITDKLFTFVCSLFVILACTSDDPLAFDIINRSPSNFEFFVDDITNNSVTISWIESTDPERTAVTYSVYKNYEDPALIEGLAATTYTIEGITANSSIIIQVVATDEDGKTTQSLAKTVALIPNEGPTDFIVTVEEVKLNEASFSWTPSTDPEGGPIFYNLFYRIEDNRNRDFILLEENYTETTYTLAGIEPGFDYSFFVRAIDQAGLSSGVVTDFSTVTNRPPVMGPITMTDSTPTSVTLDWADVFDPDGQVVTYTIFREGVDIPLGQTTNSTFTISGLPSGESFGVRVKAEDTLGAFTFSQFINVGTTSPNPPNPITGFVATEVNTRSVKFSWDATTDPDGDRFNYFITINGQIIGITADTENSLYTSNLTADVMQPGTTYAVQIYARDNFGSQSTPTSISITTATALTEFKILPNTITYSSNILFFSVNDNFSLKRIVLPNGFVVQPATDPEDAENKFELSGSIGVRFRLSDVQRQAVINGSNKTATLVYDIGPGELTIPIDISLIQ